MSNTLADFADDDVAGRYPVVQEIKALSREIADTYKGPRPIVIPEGNLPKAPANVIEALQQKQNVMTNISKWKRKFENAGNPDDRRKVEEKLAQLNQQKETLNALIEESRHAAQSPST